MPDSPLPQGSQPSPRMLPDRRQFLQRSTLAVAGSSMLGTLSLTRSAHAAGTDEIKVGLVGCGGRGTGAASDSMTAEPSARLWAMGDMFPDRLESSLKTLEGKHPDRIQVDGARKFSGVDAYKQVIDSGVDVVLLCTPPHFRPAHIEYAIANNKHVFAEKPVAVDAPGVRRVMAMTAEAQRRGLSFGCGLASRYGQAHREIVSRIHDGAIGRILSVEVPRHGGTLWMFPRKPEWSDMEWQLRNWYYFTWLSGDHNVEQHIHSIDKAAWILNDEAPVQALGVGGRQVRTDPAYGNIFDHHCVVYEYADGKKAHANCRQMKGCANQQLDLAIGTEGKATLVAPSRGKIPSYSIVSHDGKLVYEYKGPQRSMFVIEHEELFRGMREGKPVNDGHFHAQSTLMAIMGRMATYTGKVVTWDQALNSTEDLSPPNYEFGPYPAPAVAVPGVTPLV